MKKFLITILFVPIVYLSAYAQPEGWDMYIAQYEDGPGSVTLNMELIETAPIKELPYLVITGVTHAPCDETGLPDAKQFKNLYKISDDVRSEISKAAKSEVVGTFTCHCERLEYIYVQDTLTIRRALEELYQKKYRNYKYSVEISVDESWETYREFLYPSEEILEYMSNEKILEQLEAAGDKLTKPRKVDHTFYFPADQDRALFIAYAKDKKFKIESSDHVRDASLPYQLLISRIDKVDSESIHALTLELRRKAKEFKGDYDGWKTAVVK